MEKIIIQVEKKDGKVIVGRMFGANFEYTQVPESVSYMRIAFETWLAQQMKKSQPGLDYEVRGQEEVWPS